MAIELDHTIVHPPRAASAATAPAENWADSWCPLR